jgi:hypothetical protein
VPYKLTLLDFVCALTLAVLLLGAASFRRVPGVTGVVHDDGVYVATARALATGQGYRLINLPDEPRQTKYPILYPALLAVVWWLAPPFPGNVVLMQWVTIIAGVSAVGLAYLYLVRFRYCTRLEAAGAVAACATSPMLVYLTTLTMSEMVFALLLLIALWRAERSTEENVLSPSAQFTTGVIVALPFLCRSVGVALIAAVLLSLLWRGRPVVRSAVGSFVVVGGWMLWAAPALGGWTGTANVTTGYYTDYLGASMLGRAEALQMLGANALLVIMGSAGGWLEGVRSGPLAASSGMLIFLVFGCSAWLAILKEARHFRVLTVFLLAYACLVIAWPWPPARFLVPVLPMLAAYGLSGLAGIVSRVLPAAERWWLYVTAATCAAAVVGNLAVLRTVTDASSRLGYPVDGVPADLSAAAPGRWHDYEALFDWIRTQTPEDAVLAAGMDTMVFLYTDRHAFRPAVYRPEVAYGASGSAVGNPQEVMRLLEEGGATHLVLLPGFPEWRELRRVVETVKGRYPGVLEPVYRGSDERFEVFTVASPARTP